MIKATHVIVGADPLHPLVVDFLAATGITNSTIISALNDLAWTWENYGIWVRMHAVYPFVGGTAATHKYNMLDAQDTDAAYRLTFNGTWSHGSSGADPNGSTGWANTHISPSVVFNTTDLESFGVYITSATTDGVGSYVMGAYDGSNGATCNMIIKRPSTLYLVGADYASGTSYRVASLISADSSYHPPGMYMGNQKGSHIDMYIKRSGSYDIITDKTASLGLAKGSSPIALGARTTGASPAAGEYSTHTLGFAFIGIQQSDPIAVIIYNSIKTFNAALGR